MKIRLIEIKKKVKLVQLNEHYLCSLSPCMMIMIPLKTQVNDFKFGTRRSIKIIVKALTHEI